MPIYRIYTTEIIEREHLVEADNEDEAEATLLKDRDANMDRWDAESEVHYFDFEINDSLEED